MHRAIAGKVRENPELAEIARRNLERWLPGSGNARPYLEAWRMILDAPLDAMLRMIEEDSERMAAMRQNSPFAGVLTPKERWAIYRQFGRGKAAADDAG